MGGEVKSMPRAGVLLLLVVLVAACGKPLGGPPLTSNDYNLYEEVISQGSGSIAVIDSRSQNVERKLPDGALSVDYRHLYSTSSKT